MSSEFVIDVAGTLPSDLSARADLWPAGKQESGAHTTRYGLGAFASRSHYPDPVALSVCDSANRIHLSVWLRDGVAVKADGRSFTVKGRDIVIGYLPGTAWHTRFVGHAYHVGLLLTPELFREIGGDPGEAFFERLRKEGFLRVGPGNASILRAAHELDAILLNQASSPLLREAKSLELLAHMIDAGPLLTPLQLTRRHSDQLHHARDVLLADLAQSPSLEELARACGLNTFKLKQGFKQLFGSSVHALYQQERMRKAWQLITSGQLSISEAGYVVGYTNLSHFSVAFRKEFGVLPSEIKGLG